MKMDYDVKVAAEKIRRWQKNSGLQGKEVAKAIGISAPYYSDIRKGKQRGSIGVLAQIANVLGHSVEELFQKTKGKDIQALQAVKVRDFKKALTPILGKQTDDLVNCFLVWREAPFKVKQALAILCDVDIK